MTKPKKSAAKKSGKPKRVNIHWVVRRTELRAQIITLLKSHGAALEQGAIADQLHVSKARVASVLGELVHSKQVFMNREGVKRLYRVEPSNQPSPSNPGSKRSKSKAVGKGHQVNGEIELSLNGVTVTVREPASVVVGRDPATGRVRIEIA